MHFLGRVGQDEIREHYARADAFCLSSLGEGIPVVLMEAMAMRMPVIAPRIMGIPELVEDGVSGLLVTPGARMRWLTRLPRSPPGVTNGPPWARLDELASPSSSKSLHARASLTQSSLGRSGARAPSRH